MAKQTFTTGQVLTAAQMTSLQQTAMLGGAASAKVASYTLVAADAGTAITMSNASATTITVNTALFAAGDTVQITNIGAGVCTITAGTATVNTSASLALAQYEGGTLDFTSASAAIFIKGSGAAAASGGLTFISRTTFSAASGVNVDTIFSNTYENYIVCGQFISSSGQPAILMQGRHGSSTITSGGYYYGLSKAGASGAISIVQGSNDNHFTMCYDSSSGTQDSLININVYRKTTGNLTWTGTTWADNSYIGAAGAGAIYESQTYTGLRFTSATGTITGQVTVYGLASS